MEKGRVWGSGREGATFPERFYQALIENSQDIILVLEADGAIRYASPAFQRILGHRPEEVVGRDAFSFLHPQDLPEVRRRFAAGLEVQGAVVKSEYRVRHAEGRWVHVEAVGRNLLRDPTVRGIVINSRDISDRRLAEEELCRSERYFRSLIENALDIITVLDREGRVLYESPSFYRELGYAPGEVLGKSAFDFIHPEDRERIAETFFEGTKHPGVKISTWYRLRHRDGSWRFFEAVGVNLLEDPSVRGVVVNSRDVSERMAYERELEENAQRLRDFLAVASHELYHPIAIIKGYAQALARELAEGGDREARQTARALEKAADRLKDLGDDLLDISRLELGGVSLRLAEVDLGEILAEAAAEMEARGLAVPISLAGPSTAVKVRADGEAVLRVLAILIENAADHSPPGESIDLVGETSDGSAVISVLDRGPGVPEGQRERIFERFYQAEGVRHHSRPGLGLGLYIARKVVEGHGGRIWYEPRPDGGSVFRLTLPLMD